MSPKECLHHASHALIGRTAQKVSAASDGNAARNFPDLASCAILNKMAAAETVSSGRLLNFVRNVAANARPAKIPRRKLNISARMIFTRKMNATPKHNG